MQRLLPVVLLAMSSVYAHAQSRPITTPAIASGLDAGNVRPGFRPFPTPSIGTPRSVADAAETGERGCHHDRQ
jgi:hypothetical protein